MDIAIGLVGRYWMAGISMLLNVVLLLHFVIADAGKWVHKGLTASYLVDNKVVVRLTMQDESRPPVNVDGVTVFRNVHDDLLDRSYNVCGVLKGKIIWSREYDLASPKPFIYSSTRVIARYGWLTFEASATVKDKKADWRFRQDSERVESIEASGRTLFDASVYAVGEPVCFLGDNTFLSVRQTNAYQYLYQDAGPHYVTELRRSDNAALLARWPCGLEVSSNDQVRVSLASKGVTLRCQGEELAAIKGRVLVLPDGSRISASIWKAGATNQICPPK